MEGPRRDCDATPDLTRRERTAAALARAGIQCLFWRVTRHGSATQPLPPRQGAVVVCGSGAGSGRGWPGGAGGSLEEERSC